MATWRLCSLDLIQFYDCPAPPTPHPEDPHLQMPLTTYNTRFLGKKPSNFSTIKRECLKVDIPTVLSL